MLYELEVLVDLSHPDGRIFVAGHNAEQLSRVEAADLLRDYPDNFAPGNKATVQLAEELALGV